MREQGVILYDGHCKLCSWTVRWIIRNDRHRRFSYRALQVSDQSGNKGQKSGMEYPVKETRTTETVLLVIGGKHFERSSAVLQIAIRLRFPWPLLGFFFVLPRFIRDPLYDLVARNRKRWFGERATCYIP